MKDEVRRVALLVVLMIVPAVAGFGGSAASFRPSKTDASIRKIDFRNFRYPWTEEMKWNDGREFTLKNGKRPVASKDATGVSLETIVYGDVTGDDREEALIALSADTGGSSAPYMVYVYTLKAKKPKLLWAFDTGDRAEGGFKKIYAENGGLIVETFGESRFEDDRWEFSFPKKKKFGGYCCPTAYTKIRFRWNGARFEPDGEPELCDYDWKNPKN